jgi:hypothetical protein
MFMHTDNLAYKDQGIGYATSNKITGPYVYRGLLLFDGKPIKKWDMGTFQDKDGSGYLLIHGGFIYKLSDDYRSISALVNNQIARGFESPAMFRRRNVYYFLGSHLTGWERNDNDYYTATSLSGPWTLRGTFAPEGTLTWNSQTTFVLPIEGSKDTTFMFMGDRWSFPKQASAATYVWQPLTVDDTSISLPEFHDAWSVNLATGQVSIVNKEKKTIGNTDKSIRYTGRWEHPSDTATLASSNEKGASFSVKLKGRQFSLYSMARPDGGYAFITLQNSKGKTVLSSTVDMYCKYPLSTLKFVTPILPEGNYKLTVSVMGERWYWIDKRQNRSGSSGDFISLDKIVINQ